MLTNLRPGATLLSLTCLVGACTQPIPDDSADALTSLTERASSALTAPLTVLTESHSEAAYNRRLCAYLSGHSNFELVSRPGPANVSQIVRHQATVGMALQSYLTALLEASRGGGIDALQTAQAEFATATGSFAEQVGGPSASGNIVGATVILANQIGESRRQDRVRQIMDVMIGPLADLERGMAQDVAHVVGETEASLTLWDRAARCVLREELRGGARTETFEAFDERRQTMSRQLAAIENGPDIVRELNRMHIRVVEEEEPLADSFDTIVTTLERIDALIDALS